MSGTASAQSLPRRSGTSGLWVPPGAVFYADFPSGQGWVNGHPASAASLLNCVRGSDKNADNRAGSYRLFGPNVPAITDRGLNVEGSGANDLRNNAMQGVVPGSPGTPPNYWSLTGSVNGLTREISDVVLINGVECLKVRWHGTTSAQTDINIRPETSTLQVPAAQGEAWTSSCLFALIAGANPFSSSHLYVLEMNGSGIQIASGSTSVALTGDLRRSSISATFANASAAAAFFNTIFRIPVNTPCDFTLLIGLPTLEKSPFATSPIRTAGSAATRAADNITTALAGTPEGSVIIRARTAPGVPASGAQFLFQWDGGSANNRIYGYRDAATRNIFCAVIAGGVTQASLNLGAVADDSPFKLGLSWRANDFVALLNGGAPVTDTSGSIPAGLSTFRYGMSTAGNYWNGLFDRVALGPWRSGSELQQIISALAA